MRHVVITGNIAAGKTTLVKNLTNIGGVEQYLEPAEENPYLVSFYMDMYNYSYKMESFLNINRAEQHKEIMDKVSMKVAIQDRSIYDNRIFAKILKSDKNMSIADYDLFIRQFKLFTSMLKAPQLIVYLRTSPDVIFNRIKQRSRAGEELIPMDYLIKLHNGYENFIKNTKIETIIIDYNDFGDVVDIHKQIFMRIYE